MNPNHLHGNTSLNSLPQSNMNRSGNSTPASQEQAFWLGRLFTWVANGVNALIKKINDFFSALYCNDSSSFRSAQPTAGTPMVKNLSGELLLQQTDLVSDQALTNDELSKIDNDNETQKDGLEYLHAPSVNENVEDLTLVKPHEQTDEGFVDLQHNHVDPNRQFALSLSDDQFGIITSMADGRALTAIACVNKRYNAVVTKIFIESLSEKLGSFFQQIPFGEGATFKCQLGSEDWITLTWITCHTVYEKRQSAADEKHRSLPQHTETYSLPSKGEIKMVGCNGSSQRAGMCNERFLNGKFYQYLVLHKIPLNGSRQIRLVFDTIKNLAEEKISDMIKSQTT